MTEDCKFVPPRGERRTSPPLDNCGRQASELHANGVIASAADVETKLPIETDLSLDDLHAEIEKSVRAVDLLMKKRIREYEAERSALLDQLSEEQARGRENERRLARQDKEIDRLRGALAIMEVSHSRQEQEIDSLEDEFDRMISDVEARAKIALREADLRAKQEYEEALRTSRSEHKRSADLLKQAHELDLQRMHLEADRVRQNHQEELEALSRKLDLLREEIAQMRATIIWRSTKPFRAVATMLRKP